jgi:hypothetical protein
LKKKLAAGRSCLCNSKLKIVEGKRFDEGVKEWRREKTSSKEAEQGTEESDDNEATAVDCCEGDLRFVSQVVFTLLGGSGPSSLEAQSGAL